MKSVAVFFGGQSVEHDISLITGVMTVNSIEKDKFNSIPILVDKEGVWYTGESLLDLDNYKKLDFSKLKRVTVINGDNTLYQIKGKKLLPIEKIFMAINCMHGENGEDGSLVGVLKMSGIAYCSPDMLASSISMDKNFTKLVMKGLNIPTVKGVLIKDFKDIDQVIQKIGFPMIVKPNLLGSSIGVRRADDKNELIEAVNYALRYGESAIVEKCLENVTEINCAVYRDGQNLIVSECEKPVMKGDFLTFNDKYKSGKRVFPADIDKKYSDKIKSITKKVYQNLNFNGVIRIDYFLCDGKVYLNEINSVPGSLSYYLFGDTLKSFSKMLTALILQGEKEYLQNCSFIREYNSGILMGFGAKGSKRL